MAASRDEVYERVKEVLTEQLGVEEGDITEEASFQEDLDADSLDLVELIQAEHARQFWLDPRRARVEPPGAQHELIGLEANGLRVEVGRFLTEWKRREFAQELRQELRCALASGS